MSLLTMLGFLSGRWGDKGIGRSGYNWSQWNSSAREVHIWSIV